MRGVVGFVAALMLVSFGGWNGTGLAADPPLKGERKGEGTAESGRGTPASPGCLGVEVAKTASGKSVIFAWFEDKKAALAWYKNDVHQESMR